MSESSPVYEGIKTLLYKYWIYSFSSESSPVYEGIKTDLRILLN
ncbi:hypothetical protein BPUTEOMOX_3 [methanotrophic endosymbiont of Bathymodiolus puteoserpentis (Logatchev)]|nr:hypothetical protein BPUTEOMOX_3 [methanotrophic endosymbiont of Bathymodiolus puteoserpentis (Logatchev)]